MLFLLLSTFQPFYVLSIRSTDQTFYIRGPFSNYRLTVAVLISLTLQFAVIYVPIPQKLFHTVSLEPGNLILEFLVSTLAFVVAESAKLIRSQTADGRPS